MDVITAGRIHSAVINLQSGEPASLDFRVPWKQPDCSAPIQVVRGFFDPFSKVVVRCHGRSTHSARLDGISELSDLACAKLQCGAAHPSLLAGRRPPMTTSPESPS